MMNYEEAKQIAAELVALNNETDAHEMLVEGISVDHIRKMVNDGYIKTNGHLVHYYLPDANGIKHNTPDYECYVLG